MRTVPRGAGVYLIWTNFESIFLALYKTEMGLPLVLPVIRDVEIMMANDMTANHEELPPFGLSSFRKAVTELVLGKKHHSLMEEGRVLTVQTLSSTGALRLICEIVHKQLKCEEMYLSYPKWDSYQSVCKAAGFSEPKTFRYYDGSTHQLDLPGMLEDLQNIPYGSVVILQACCHNPSGCDPNKKQWHQIANAIMGRVFPIIYMGYQGLATGSPEEDAYPIRLFARLGLEMAVAMSFSHNFLVYNDRVGAAIFVLENKNDIIPLKSHICTMITSQYGSPPYHGAQIIATILNDLELHEKWVDCLYHIVLHIEEVRNKLADSLKAHNVPGNWDYIRTGRGVNTMTHLTDLQVQHMVLYHHIYVRKYGRLNLCGLNSISIDYVAEAIADSIREYPKLEF